MTSLSFFRFFANLEKSGDQISDTESAKVMFSVIGIFCLTKTENRTKKSQTQLSHYSIELRYFLDKNANFLQKNADISKIKGV